MFRKTTFAIALALVLLLAFSTVCIAAPAIFVNGKPLAAKPNPQGLVSAKAVFKALGCKIAIDKKGIMKVAKGKNMLILNGKKVTLNKKPVKIVIIKTRGDYWIPTTLVTRLTGVPARYYPKTMTAIIGKNPIPPAAKPAPKPPAVPETKPETKPEQKPAEQSAPGGLVGDKALAYNMLTNSKYSGKAESAWDASITNVIIIGSANPKLKTRSTSARTLITTENVPLLAGGNVADKECPKVPLIEIVNGKESDLVDFLKKAESVTVSGDKITINKTEPPDSIILLLNLISSKVTFRAADLRMSCSIKLGASSVLSIDEVLITGIAHGSNEMPSTINGSVQY